jgi:hypothetical protein
MVALSRRRRAARTRTLTRPARPRRGPVTAADINAQAAAIRAKLAADPGLCPCLGCGVVTAGRDIVMFALGDEMAMVGIPACPACRADEAVGRRIGLALARRPEVLRPVAMAPPGRLHAPLASRGRSG